MQCRNMGNDPLKLYGKHKEVSMQLLRLNRLSRLLLIVMLISIASVGLLSPARATTAAASRSWVWTRWDVDISAMNTSANSFHVGESHQITVTQGSFGGGDRSISRDRLTEIRNVKVTDGETSLRYMQASSAS